MENRGSKWATNQGLKDCEEGFEDSEGKGNTGLKMMK
jgi:hypothetical protein